MRRQKTKLLPVIRIPLRSYIVNQADQPLEKPVKHTKEAYLPLLRACNSLDSLRKIHQWMVHNRVFVDKLTKNVLIDMYGKCGSLDDSLSVFQSIQDRDGPNVFSWTLLITAYARNGHHPAALELFHRMQLVGVRPSEATLVVAIGICAKSGAPRGLETGKKIHQQIQEQCVVASSSKVRTALLDMYSKCGCERRAREIFQSLESTDIVWWTAMLGALVRCSDSRGALALYGRMALEGIPANSATFVLALTACSCSSCCPSQRQKVASQIQRESLAQGLLSNPMLASALVNFYTKHRSFQESWNFFQELGSSSASRSLSCWNAMMHCCASKGFHDRALDLYHQMVDARIDRDEVTFSITLSCCQNVNDAQKILRDAATAGGRDQFDQVRSAAIDLYARAGHLDISRRIFERDPHCRSLSCWNALIGAYAQHGHGRQSLDLFQRMKVEGVAPDQLTFVSAMFASSHAGLLDQALDCFLEMGSDHGIAPGPEHWRCLIDLLGRAGQIDGAEAVIEENGGEMEWSILMGACKNQADECLKF